MALKNSDQYRDDLKPLRPSVYIRGEKIDNVSEDDRLQSTLNLVGVNHDTAFDPNMKDLAVVDEPLVGEPATPSVDTTHNTFEKQGGLIS